MILSSFVEFLKEDTSDDASFLLFEDVTDVPENASPEEIIDTITQRLAAAKKGLGLANKLKNPADKAKHRSRMMGNVNKIRGLLGRLVKKLGTVEYNNPASEEKEDLKVSMDKKKEADKKTSNAEKAKGVKYERPDPEERARLKKIMDEKKQRELEKY